MAHRRVKDIAYDEDDRDYSDDEYYGDEGAEDTGDGEMSAEDKEQMRVGTIDVRASLGDEFQAFFTDAQIQEALWHYFYDVGKSVTYLKNQHAPQQPKQQKAKKASKFDLAAATASQKPVEINNGEPCFSFKYQPVPPHRDMSRATQRTERDNHTSGALSSSSIQAHCGTASENKRVDWPIAHMPAVPFFNSPCNSTFATDPFKDIPWHNVPEERKGSILIEPLHPPLMLLGGSAPGGKPSKLAALAAARKKKEADQKAGNVAANEDKQTGAASLLDRLGSKPNQRPQPQLADPVQPEDLQPIAQRAYPIRKRKSPSPPPPVADRRPSPSESTTSQPAIPPPNLPSIRADPSIFAQAMCGGGAKRSSTHADAVHFRENIVPTLYGNDSKFANTNPFAGPSPDDVVQQAQAKAAAAKKQMGQKKDTKSVSSVTNGVSDLSVADTPAVKIKSKNLDVVAEYEKSGRKNAASFVVIGHVDHGKSTLMGRLLYDLKVIDQRSIDKLRKEATNIGKSSFALAWVMDATSEERERGVTVDIATNNFETDKTKFTILDAPGHRDFIPNMIAGASQADFAVLVIDAGTNSFEAGLKGQTREHAQLVRSMGCQRIIVAVNKMDSVQWSEDRFSEIQQQIFAFLEKTGFQGKNIAFVPCSGLTGENVVNPPPEVASWYIKTSNPQTLVQALESFEPAKAAVSSPLRLPISDIFRGGIQNPLSISGRIEAGSLQVGDQILAMPASETAIIKGIEIDTESAEWAVAGQIVTLHLSEIDPIHLRIADVLCDPRKPIRNIKSFDVKILAFEHVLPMQVDVHRGRMHVPGRVTQMSAVLDKASGEVLKKKPRVVQPGAVARVRVELDTAVPLEVPGRIVLRSGGATVAAGLLEVVHA